jgi:uncharacterized protein (UPF0332 family)
MTDMQSLFQYRWNLAIETLDDAKKIFSTHGTPRSVVNRAYYAMFYAVLALFIKSGTQAQTSKHTVIIGIFDTEFIKTARLPRELSRMLHRAFDDRQEFDYKDFVEVDSANAEESLDDARAFIDKIDEYIKHHSG